MSKVSLHYKYSLSHYILKVKKIITVGNPASKPRSLHMKYGIDNEDKACEMFQRQLIDSGKVVSLRKCGLYVHPKHGQIAASPDRVGTVNGENIVVEVKCLSASRSLSPLDAVTQKQKESNFAFKIQDEKIVLKERHSYFYQVQMQMAVTGRQVAYFVIFTNENVSVEWIKLQFDDSFWTQIECKLLNFHTQHVVPALVAQRFK